VSPSSLRRSGAVALLLALAALLSAGPAGAQRLQGRVLRGDRPVPGVPVELHRVTRAASGVVQQGVSGADGSFTFTLPPPDSSGFTVLFATAYHQGVRYFGTPLHSSESLAGYSVQVYDTVTVARGAAPVRVSRRDVIVFPDADGGAEVDEIVQVQNVGDRTVVGDGGMPVWEFLLPDSAGAFEVGDGQISPQSVKRMGNRVLVSGPLPPGRHELFLRYRLPRRAKRTTFPVAAATDSMNLFVRQPAVEARVEGLGGGQVVEAEKEKFLRFSGAALDGKRPVVLALRNPSAPPVDPRAAAAGVTGLLLAVGAVVAARRRQGAGSR